MTAWFSIAVGAKNSLGANKICPNVFYLPEYDRFSWQISRYKLLKLGDWAIAVPEVNGVSPKLTNGVRH